MTASLAGARVLVTGGAGFIGASLAARLAPVAEVCVLDDLSTGHADRVPDAATLVEGDIRDEAALAEAAADVDVIYHLAADVRPAASIDRPRATHHTNVTGTVDVLEQARAAGQPVVFASSAAVYGEPATLPLAEDAPTRPETPYGLSKLVGERYLALYADLYGLETAALRLFNVYGPRQRDAYAGVIATFADQARAGGPLTVHGNGAQTRDFVHIDDVVEAFVAVLETDLAGESFNVATGESTSVRRLAELVRAAHGDGLEIAHEAPRAGDISDSRAAIERAADAFGFAPTVPLEAGLRTVLDDATPHPPIE